ncbi:MAG: hypothetical protein LBQ73_02230 [Tannerellaceae bacterium]|nr:hypothetical protein [Tannerellaceae bacterium]
MKFVALLCALLFNVVAGSAIALATGLPPAGVVGAGALLSTLTRSTGAGMAIQKEIWVNTIIEGLFADNSFISKAINADQFVNQGKTVHIPNAGAPSGVEKNRTNLPAAINVRTDLDLTFNLDEFTTNPIRIPHADTVELSYNKRESVLRQDRAKLIETIADAFTFYWAPTAANTIKTTGAEVSAHTTAATGVRKAFTTADVNAAMVKFDMQNVPQEGRYMLVDAVMYNQLLQSMTKYEQVAFHAAADIKTGRIGKLLTFNFMMRSKALRYTGGGAAKEWTTGGAATDNAAALAWWDGAVYRALGEVVAFDNTSDPTYYGDIYSFLIRCGGRPARNGVEGVLAIVQDTATA